MPEGPLGGSRPGSVPIVKIQVVLESMPDGDPDIFEEGLIASMSEEIGENIEIEVAEHTNTDSLTGEPTVSFKLSTGGVTSGMFQFTADSLGRIEQSIKQQSSVGVRKVFLQIK